MLKLFNLLRCMFWQRWVLKNSFLKKFTSKFGIRGELVLVGKRQLWVDSFGDRKDPALLLLMGGGCQGIIWTEDFCEKLAAEGLFVLRFDQRDTGFSSYCDWEIEPYTLLDMAKDVKDLLDEFQISKAHLMGISMGGAIAQLMGAHFPSYVRSLTLLATTNYFYPLGSAMQGKVSENFLLPYPEPAWLKWVLEVEKLPRFAFGKRIRKHMEGWRILNGNRVEFPGKYYFNVLSLSIQRQRSYKALLNHRSALLASLDLVYQTKGKIDVPTLIIQGGCDPLFPQEHGRHLASSIKGSKYWVIEEMGHNFCPCFHEKVSKEVISFIKGC